MPPEPSAEPDHKPLRLFAAVEIPERTRAEVERAIEPWRARLPTARWVKPENWHVTVKFMGRTDRALVDRVREACRTATFGIRPFRVRLGGLGVFPRATRARVFWVALEGDEGGLVALAAGLEAEVRHVFPAEKRPFTAHLTVARLNPPAPVDAAELERTEPDPAPFRVGELVLFRSHLSPKGARYEPIDRFPLRGRA